jgi:hypothetical protein
MLDKKRGKVKGEKKEAVGKKTTKLIWLFLLVLLGLVTAGLFQRFLGTFLSRTREGVGEVEKSGQEVTASSKEQEFLFETQEELPEDFPDNFPIYPGSILTSSGSVEGKEVKAFSVVWETKDAVEEVASYYQKELIALGWKIELTSGNNDSATLSFEKDEVVGFVGIAAEEAKTVIAATLGIK